MKTLFISNIMRKW